MRQPLNRPTDVELSILRILWELGPATVRQVHEALCVARDESLAYTAALKMMQTMTEKGLLKRDESGRSHIYRPAQARERTLRQLVDDLMERAFGGSALELVNTALSDRPLDGAERLAVEKLLTKAKEKRS